MSWRFHIDHQPWRGPGRDLYIVRERADGKRDHVAALTFVTIEENNKIVDPSLPPGEATEFLRAALNAAWEAGLRPDGWLDTRESMAATAKHLEDMRALAFNNTGAQKP